MTVYPAELPLEDIRKVVSLVRSNTVGDNKAEFANCVWTVQGYAQSQIFGKPGIRIIAQEDNAIKAQAKDSCDPIELLERIIVEADSVTAQSSKDPSKLSMSDWLTIIKWVIEMLVKLN